MLRVDEETINRLFESYGKHIPVLHPFLDLASLATTKEKFVRRYSPRREAVPSRFAVNRVQCSPTPSLSEPLSIGMKRKRSEQSLPPAPPLGFRNTGPVRPIEYTVDNAIVLALGKVCKHKEPLSFPGDLALLGISVELCIYKEMYTSQL